MAPLSILSVAYPFAPVGSEVAGGAEQILTLLDRALVHGGHASYVAADERSQISGTLIPFPSVPGPLDPPAMDAARKRFAELIQVALGKFQPDLIHMHGLDCARYLPETDLPVLVTIHLPPDWYPKELYEGARKNLHLVCVSAHQFSSAPSSRALLTYIPNGVDLAQFSYQGKTRDYVLALGRICPEKGFHLAMDAAKAAGVTMLLAGQVFPYEDHQRYFEREIRPRLGEHCKFVGLPCAEQKTKLLAEARAVLIPSLVAETSSLVAMEALASGTPVIAFPAGALPEIVDDGKTGFIVKDPEAMSAAIPRAPSIDPDTCRQAAHCRFSADRMTARYLQLYQTLCSGCPD